ncbi:MAG: o-succinylbenzoate synthase [Bacteroidota bacterium]
MLNYSIEKKIFQFKTPSGTSRGILTQKLAWFIKLWNVNNQKVFGLGECSIIEGLSPDFKDEISYEKNLDLFLKEFISKVNLENDFTEFTTLLSELKNFPSILFGLETAFIDLKNGGKQLFFDTKFTQGKASIPINGLIWMGNEAFIQEQIEEKLQVGFSCIKMKIGALNFEEEFNILEQLRKRFSKKELILRVDANGAFSTKNAEILLEKLALLDLHSIEQPVKAGNWNEMAELCLKTKLPIALDEELIGVNEKVEKIKLLETIKPQFIILKPSLHGGIIGTQEWINLATERNIPWWMTSALESNIALNAIAQLTSIYKNDLHQGLGTGSLYLENFPTNLSIRNGQMYFLNS